MLYVEKDTVQNKPLCDKYAYQEIAVTGTEEDIYIASCWSRANAVPNPEGVNRMFDVFARVYYSDNSSYLKEMSGEFNRDLASWQRASFVFDLSDGTDTVKTPVKILFIGYNSPENLIILKIGLHRRLHTNLYYGWANSVVISAYNSANGDEMEQRIRVRAALSTIKGCLRAINQIAPY